ncbi:hypothetical protein [Dyella sp. 20L07]|uniref:hypothetical protein n=1 Tax=Dyella sp. 20L07 TaxID=3384240 RepID=UPI003D2DF63B
MKPFPQADFLDYLERLGQLAPVADTPMPAALAGLLLMPDESKHLSPAGDAMILLLKTRKATLQAAFDTELAADELRRYQKYAKPGQPSPHIVQLRQKQAAARQATNVARQSYIKAATAFVREASITVPSRVALDEFISDWINTNVPKDVGRIA